MTHLMYDKYETHCRYFGIVLKLMKKPLNMRIGMDVTGPKKTAACAV